MTRSTCRRSRRSFGSASSFLLRPHSVRRYELGFHFQAHRRRPLLLHRQVRNPAPTAARCRFQLASGALSRVCPGRSLHWTRRLFPCLADLRLSRLSRCGLEADRAPSTTRRTTKGGGVRQQGAVPTQSDRYIRGREPGSGAQRCKALSAAGRSRPTGRHASAGRQALCPLRGFDSGCTSRIRRSGAGKELDGCV